jgi:hypothetical protein
MGARTNGSGSFASLAPRLLARKGTARPAMRTAHSNELDALAAAQSELGWDDSGEPRGAVIPMQRRKAAHAPAPAPAAGRRAAFTLRLDSDRHLRLRLASMLKDCSAQVLVTEALDRFLEDIPQLETMAAQCERSSSKA